MIGNDIATRANRLVYDAMQAGEYMVDAPHLSHESIRSLYVQMVSSAFEIASQDGLVPTVLDLGAGDGIATKPFLSLGAHVVAVDISMQQLAQLRAECAEYGDRIEIRCADVFEVLGEDRKFDIVVANSFLHHVPDYLSLVARASDVLSERGILMTFQDPMWGKSITPRDALLSGIVYLIWRLGRADVLRGIGRKLRRTLGIYSATSIYDNAEYHAVRDGVNQIAIQQMLEKKGWQCSVVEYCSFHSMKLQPLGEKLGVKNTFAIIATRGGNLENAKTSI